MGLELLLLLLVLGVILDVLHHDSTMPFYHPVRSYISLSQLPIPKCFGSDALGALGRMVVVEFCPGSIKRGSSLPSANLLVGIIAYTYEGADDGGTILPQPPLPFCPKKTSHPYPTTQPVAVGCLIVEQWQ